MLVGWLSVLVKFTMTVDRSMTRSNGQVSASAAHGSASGRPDTTANSERGLRKSTPAHTPSPRPGAGTSNDRTLEELHARLDPEVFWRVHRSHLVNINKVKEIVPWFSRNYILRMTDAKATEIPVSRSHTRRLREYLKL